MIKPTIGRVVWMRNRPGNISGDQPEDAHVVYVHSDTCVNLAGFDANGAHWAMTSVFLRQDDVPISELAPFGYCEWMPYQKDQAKKHEGDQK